MKERKSPAKRCLKTWDFNKRSRKLKVRWKNCRYRELPVMLPNIQNHLAHLRSECIFYIDFSLNRKIMRSRILLANMYSIYRISRI